MGEPIPGQNGENNTEENESQIRRFEGLITINGIKIHVYWRNEVGAYVIEFPFLNEEKEKAKKEQVSKVTAFGEDDEFAEQVFWAAREAASMYSGEDADIDVATYTRNEINGKH